jgi:hypothetical protein
MKNLLSLAVLMSFSAAHAASDYWCLTRVNGTDSERITVKKVADTSVFQTEEGRDVVIYSEHNHQCADVENCFVRRGDTMSLKQNADGTISMARQGIGGIGGEPELLDKVDALTLNSENRLLSATINSTTYYLFYTGSDLCAIADPNYKGTCDFFRLEIFPASKPTDMDPSKGTWNEGICPSGLQPGSGGGIEPPPK